MEFNKLISEKLHPLFTDNGFKLTEQSKHSVDYKSGSLVIAMFHNQFDNSYTLWIGRDCFQSVEIDNEVMTGFFNSDLKFCNLPRETFVNNVFLFFTGEGESLIKGNESDFISLEKFSDRRSDEYEESQLNEQYLEAANIAWKEGNYTDVIRYLKKINEESLPNSFKLKYKIAQKRIERNRKRGQSKFS